ncbi:MAG: hypothetical protein RL653_3395 [Pseudomonadota bacterium]
MPSPVRRLSWLLPLAVLQWACPAVPDIADGGTTGPFRVGPGGGDFVRDGVLISIPPNALEEELTLTVTVTDTAIPEIPGRKRISYGYRIFPTNLVLKAPLTLRLPWQEDRLVGGVRPTAFDVRRQVGTEVVPLSGAAPEQAVSGVMTAQSDRLGLFWITSPAQPTVSALDVEPEESAVLVGQEVQLTAKVKDETGEEVPGVTVTWSVVPPRVGTVDGAGKFTATAPGHAWVTAEAAGLRAEALVRVQGTTVGPTTFVHETPFPTGNDLHGAYLSAGHAAFAGENGTILVRDPAGTWTRTFSSPGVTLTAVSGVLPSAGVAVGMAGQQGVVVDFGVGTQATFKAFPTALPRAAWFDGTHGMAVGDGNDVIVRRAGQWETEYSPSFETLLSVVGDGQGGFVTVGSLGSIYRYDPASKAWDSLFQARLSVLLNAAVLLDAAGSEAWAVGGGKLWHFAYGAWTAQNLPTSPVMDSHTSLALADDKVIIGGIKDGKGYLLWKNLATGQWKFRSMRGGQLPRGLHGAGSAALAVGELGMLWEYTSDNFAETSSGAYGDVVDLAVVTGGVFAAMNECLDPQCWVKRGSILSRGANGAWGTLGGPQPFDGEVLSVAARSPTEVYAATSNALYLFDGSAWTTLTVNGAATPLFTRMAFCEGTLWVVGPTGGTWRGSSSTGQPVQTVSAVTSGLFGPTEDLQALACANANDVWIAGNGTLLQNRSPRTSGNFRHADWRAAWSPGPGECYAFGDAPFGFYWDTTRLRVVEELGPLRPDVIHSLWGSQPDNLYAVGMSSLPSRFAFALRFDGLQWSVVDPGTAQEPLVVRGRSDTELWIGTRKGGLLRAVAP